MSNKIICVAAPLAALLMAGTAMAAGKGAPPASAVQNAANAGINLLNTVASDAGKGNGAEVVTASVATTTATYDVVTTSTETVTGDPTTTTSTTSQVLSSTVVPGTTFIQNPNANSQNWVYKAEVETVTENTTTTTTTTPTTTNLYTDTDSYLDTTVTTEYAELDPGKSQPQNQSPEDAAPAPTSVTTTELVSDGAPVLTDSTTVDDVQTTTDTTTDTTIETKVIDTPAA